MSNRPESLLHQPEFFVLQSSLDDFFVTYELNAYTREASRQLHTYAVLPMRSRLTSGDPSNILGRT